MTPTSVPVKIAGEIEIHTSSLPKMLLDEIKGGLTLVNEDRQDKLDKQEWGAWSEAETIALWREKKTRGGDDLLLLPRGVASELTRYLNGKGITIDWTDERTLAPAEFGYYRTPLLRPYQQREMIRFIQSQQGFYECPAGGGKTVWTLGLAATLGQRALIVVDKVSLANQWRVRAAEFFGFPTDVDDDGHLIAPLKGDRCAGMIGKGKWEERDFTVAIRQTLHERAWEMQATGWWKTWGLTVFDEGHHLAADTMFDICRNVRSFYLGAVSATPSGSETKGKVIHSLVGPIVAQTSREELYEAGVLVKPKVVIRPGTFSFHYHYDHSSKFDARLGRHVCQMHGCKKTFAHTHRNNYSSLKKKLYEDKERNARIVQQILSERGHKHLVGSDQHKHLDALKKELIRAGWPQDKIWDLRGEQNAKGEDQKIVQQIMLADEAVLLSTVAKEGLDVPPIDRLHIVAPMKARLGTIQLIGRVERTSKGKDDAVVNDYTEPLLKVLEDQKRERLTTYRMQGYEVVEVTGEAGEILAAVGNVHTNNTVWYSHPGCGSWEAPLDDPDRKIDVDAYQCPHCDREYPVRVDEDEAIF